MSDRLVTRVPRIPFGPDRPSPIESVKRAYARSLEQLEQSYIQKREGGERGHRAYIYVYCFSAALSACTPTLTSLETTD